METTVMLLPVCECGNIIAGLEVDKIIDVDGWKCRRPFAPERCPRCNRMIKYMTIDTKYLDAFGDHNAIKGSEVKTDESKELS